MVFVYDKSRWFRAAIAVIAVFALFVSGLMTEIQINSYALNAPRHAECMIVLGGGLDGKTGKPLSTLAYRLDRAAQLYDEGYAPYIIASGGQGRDEVISEAESMKEYLIERGVPEDVIILEAESKNTLENMEFSKRIMDEYGFSDAIIVTSDFHLWRALTLAKDAGISACGVGSKNSRSIIYTVKNLAREAMSWVKYMLKR